MFSFWRRKPIKVSPLVHPKIAFLTGYSNGFGDLIFAKRCCEDIKRELSIDVDIISSQAEVKDKLKTLELDACKEFKEVKDEYALLIIGPGVTDLPSDLQTKFNKDKIKIIVVSEYNYEDHSKIIVNNLISKGFKKKESN